MELFAAEPQVIDPVALAFDASGKCFVVEMRDYPYGLGPEGKPGGVVRLLEDFNGDGKADRSTVFAENLSFPTSIVAWKGGVLVTAPPEIIFLQDTNGDRKADVRQVWYTGFVRGVTDSNVNGLRYGLDNQIHGCNGGNGGLIAGPQLASPISIQDADFSFNPLTRAFTVTHQTSGGFGLVFDEWGRSFCTYNINHIQHRFIPLRYLRRFPGLPPAETTLSISDHGEMAPIFPISPPQTRVNHPEQAGHFSAAGGMGLLPKGLFPGDLGGSALVCDVVGNLVHRDLLAADGSGFRARRAPGETTAEFFASGDNSFRPVGVEIGPDAALYLIDMQREVIEHPDYIPEKVRKTLDLRAGENKGRIYRITVKQSGRGPSPHSRILLDQASTAQLPHFLTNLNPWVRLTAQRLLVERQEKDIVPDLQDLAAPPAHDDHGHASKSPHPTHEAMEYRLALGRLHALWTLDGLNALTVPVLLASLNDPEPGVRENALRLSEKFVSGAGDLRKKILSMAGDTSPRVRFQAALTMGEFWTPESLDALWKTLQQDAGDRFSRLACLSSLRASETNLLARALSQASARPEFVQLAAEAASLIAARHAQDPALEPWIVETSAKALRGASLSLVFNGLLAGWQRAAATPAFPPASSAVLIANVKNTGEPELAESAWRLLKLSGQGGSAELQQLLAQTKKELAGANLAPEARRSKLKLLGLAENLTSIEASLRQALDQQKGPEDLEAILGVLRNYADPKAAILVLDNWRAVPAAARPRIIHFLLSRTTYHPVLLDRIENGAIALGELNLDLEQRRLLLRESSPEVSRRAAKLIGDEEYSNRSKTVEEYFARLPSTGDPSSGKKLYELNCAKCHRFQNSGHAVGPELSNSNQRSVEDLLSNILDPNMAINPSFAAFHAETNDGELHSGVLLAESPQEITIIQAEGKKMSLPRSTIRKSYYSPISLMPEGLEKQLSPKEIRDLIAYLQAGDNNR